MSERAPAPAEGPPPADESGLDTRPDHRPDADPEADFDGGLDADGAVTPLELFFDLVFVFAITQLTSVLAHHPTPVGALQVVLLFGVLWWMYGGYAWLTNSVPPDRKSIRLLLLAGMTGFLLIALAMPTAFDGGGVLLGVAYLFIVVLHAGVYTRSSHAASATAILRVAPFNVISALLLVAGAVAGGRAQYALWILAVCVQWATPLFSPIQRFRIRSGYMVERYGLVLIIVLGESVVAIGVGAAGLPLRPPLLGTAVLALTVSALMWWLYFIDDDGRGERALAAADEPHRPALLLNAFFYAQIPMLLGVVAFASGVKLAIGHPTAAVGGAAALCLAGGVTLYVSGGALFRLAVGGPWLRRALAAVPALATVALGPNVGALAEIASLVAVLLVLLLIEARFERGPEPGAATSAAERPAP